jgi:hypothetical protein
VNARKPEKVAYVVVGYPRFRGAIEGFQNSMDMQGIGLESADEFLRHEGADTAVCLILDPVALNAWV